MIIEFRSQALRLEPRMEASSEGAEIIIFPGVRRERQTDRAKAAPQRQGPAEARPA